MKANEIGSVQVAAEWGDAEIELLACIGSGDARQCLYRGPGGVEVIVGNGLPHWECSSGFAEARADMLAR